MRILITGISGFVGSHLAEAYLQAGAEVHGTIRYRSDQVNIRHLWDAITLRACDIVDASSIRSIVERGYDRIHHLAAQSYVPESWTHPDATMRTNITGTLHLLESVRRLPHQPRIHLCGTSEEYGLVREEETPITEDHPLRPMSPYGVSKVGADLLAYQYHLSYGMDVVRTRAFNHEGPRRSAAFVTSSFAKQIAEAEVGKREPIIRHGNLEAKRDFSDVRDVVRAYILALDKGKSGEAYNICSGVAWKISDVLKHLIKLARIPVRTEVDPARMRPSDVPLLLGSAEKFVALTGWKPEIPFEQTLDDTLGYWRDRLRREG